MQSIQRQDSGHSGTTSFAVVLTSITAPPANNASGADELNNTGSG